MTEFAPAANKLYFKKNCSVLQNLKNSAENIELEL